MQPNRSETTAERFDRNWLELLQELRVLQTGIQVLAGFLLTVPFTGRFEELARHDRVLFLVAFGFAVLTIGLMSAPVAIHRLLFGRHAKDVLVRVGNRTAKVSMVALGLTLVAVTALIFDVVLGSASAVAAGLGVLVFYVLAWVVLPVSLLRRGTEWNQ